MKADRYYIIIFAVTCFFITACSNTRHLPAGDKLYTGTRTIVNGTSTIREKKVLKEDLEGLTRPKPNTKFLGIPVKLSIYNLFRNKKEKSFFGRIRDKNGEPPVLLSQLDLQQNIKVLQSHMENKGYFQAKVTGDTIVGRRRAHARYTIVAGDQYKIAAVSFPADSSMLTSTIVKSSSKTLLIKGKPFDLDVIKAERIRIDAYLKENGFYYFTPEFILVKTDTTIGNHLVNMYVTVKPGTPFESRKVYRIKDVQIYAGYSLNMNRIDSSRAQARFYKGYYIIDRRKRYKPSMFAHAMNFEPGDIYNRTDHNLTLSRLVNLDLFKFVKNRFEISTQTDSAYLDVFYYLTPLPRKSLRAEFTTTTRSNNLNGSLISLSWKDRNLFKGGEHLSISAYSGSDVQFSGALRGYNAIRFGGEINFGIPRVLVPFGDFGIKGGYMPRTNIQLGYDMLDRIKLYSLNSFRAAYGYLWKESMQKQHELYPISVNYVQPGRVTEEYNKLIHQDTLLARAIQKQFILGSTYQFNYNQLANGLQPNNAYYFNGLIDLSGNIAGLTSGANVKAGKEVMIRNVPFSQYIKFELDGRYYRKFGLYSTWANRAIIGVGIPYGNSVQLPFIKQFFIGGNNSLRGFRSRSVGPGTYRFPDSLNFLPDETGDIKLELNTEFRFRLTGPLYGALFLDAGNIWLMSDSTYTHKPGSEFTSKFLNQLAVDAGIGFRFDITLFVIRLDMAFPLRRPWEQNPWVIDQIKLFNKPWRRENIIYNLGIGYPF
ncbi:MAG TPA: BamA/TamA family outer membrane protein [Chitinophagaceae bacterium]|nr:BamA/TamA family outer membrane protein [Chitinophagaceae bacterium]